MIPIPGDAKIWLALGVTDMRRGMQGLARQVQHGLHRNPNAGDIFIFRGGFRPTSPRRSSGCRPATR